VGGKRQTGRTAYAITSASDKNNPLPQQLGGGLVISTINSFQNKNLFNIRIINLLTQVHC